MTGSEAASLVVFMVPVKSVLRCFWVDYFLLERLGSIDIGHAKLL